MRPFKVIIFVSNALEVARSGKNAFGFSYFFVNNNFAWSQYLVFCHIYYKERNIIGIKGWNSRKFAFSLTQGATFSFCLSSLFSKVPIHSHSERSKALVHFDPEPSGPPFRDARRSLDKELNGTLSSQSCSLAVTLPNRRPVFCCLGACSLFLLSQVRRLNLNFIFAVHPLIAFIRYISGGGAGYWRAASGGRRAMAA